jgi:hypothetical protein
MADRYRLLTGCYDGQEYPEEIRQVRSRGRLGRMVWYCVGMELADAQAMVEAMNTDLDFAERILWIREN